MEAELGKAKNSNGWSRAQPSQAFTLLGTHGIRNFEHCIIAGTFYRMWRQRRSQWKQKIQKILFSVQCRLNFAEICACVEIWWRTLCARMRCRWRQWNLNRFLILCRKFIQSQLCRKALRETWKLPHCLMECEIGDLRVDLAGSNFPKNSNFLFKFWWKSSTSLLFLLVDDGRIEPKNKEVILFNAEREPKRIQKFCITSKKQDWDRNCFAFMYGEPQTEMSRKRDETIGIDEKKFWRFPAMKVHRWNVQISRLIKYLENFTFS